MIADYGPGSTIVYHELLGVGGVAWSGVTPAAWITHAHVDDDASIAGGRAIWGIPKRDGDFQWVRTRSGEQLSVSLAGRGVVTVSVATRPRAATLRVTAPFVGRDGGKRAWAAGRLRGAPVSVRVQVPADSPLRELEPVFSSTAVAGDVALRIGAPRAARSG